MDDGAIESVCASESVVAVYSHGTVRTFLIPPLLIDADQAKTLTCIPESANKAPILLSTVTIEKPPLRYSPRLVSLWQNWSATPRCFVCWIAPIASQQVHRISDSGVRFEGDALVPTNQLATTSHNAVVSRIVSACVAPLEQNVIAWCLCQIKKSADKNLSIKDIFQLAAGALQIISQSLLTVRLNGPHPIVTARNAALVALGRALIQDDDAAQAARVFALSDLPPEKILTLLQARHIQIEYANQLATQTKREGATLPPVIEQNQNTQPHTHEPHNESKAIVRELLTTMSSDPRNSLEQLDSLQAHLRELATNATVQELLDVIPDNADISFFVSFLNHAYRVCASNQTFE
eukprot:c18755_g1_i3.p1 GENE.c18755_g1_i3~~c18755_g1_i3.p1  ORF type:complete len:350 (+),score=70.88 c18755_g1_i3:989-2038(+)